MSYRADKHVINAHRDGRTDGHRQTDAGNDNTRRPKLAQGKIKEMECSSGNKC